MTWLRTVLRRLARDRRGGVATVAALALPALLGAAALAIDASNWYGARAKMQSAADAAALAGGRELRLAISPERAATVAKNFALAKLASEPGMPRVAQVEARIESGKVQVDVRQDIDTYFGPLFGKEITTIAVRARAKSTGELPLCALGLEPAANDTLRFDKGARLSADRCAIYSNSLSPAGLTAGDGAFVKTSLICTAGGWSGSAVSFSPQPTKDCPPIADPLLLRPAPPIGSCTHVNKVVSGGVTSLSGGVYCGGLRVTAGARVTLQPGIYVIKDGPLLVEDGTFEGVNVGFYLTGPNAAFRFDPNTVVSLTAPKDGALAGLLFFSDRLADPSLRHVIKSNNATTMVGTFYLPAGRLVIDSAKNVALASVYTVIVARTLELDQGPNLVLNTNYDASDIPVPLGLGPYGFGTLRLER